MRKKFGCLVTVISSLAGYSSVFASGPFIDVSAQVGLVLEAKHSKGSPIWGDMNNDGILDLIVPTHGLSQSNGPFVYLGSTSGRFTDIRATCGFSNLSKFNSLDSTDWHGFSFGDYDNDGNLDLYIAEGGLGQQGGGLKRDLLFKGHGDGTFSYVSDVAGIVISGDRGREGFWVDYDNDGKLDLFVKDYITANGFVNNNHLYHNNGNGTFTQTPNAGGLADATFGKHAGSVTSFVDYNNDGFMDVAFAGESSAAALYRNQGNGTFVDVTAAAGLGSRTPTEGIAWGDYNNDGLLDLYVASGNVSSGPFRATLYRNNGNGTFTDVTLKAGVGTTGNTWAPVWGDYDNDGFLDLFVTCAGAGALGAGNANLLYHNNGNGTFTNTAVQDGLALADGTSLHKGAAWADYNNDGFLDLIIKDGLGLEGETGAGTDGLHRLFQNRHTDNGNHFIKVNLVGVQSNKRGIGARVTATTSTGKMFFRENNGGGGGEFWSQGSEPLHFGIGTAASATLKVVWPSGRSDTVAGVAANSTITITEGLNQTPALSNISTRASVRTGDGVTIAGFIISGTGPKTVLIRGLGPTLALSNIQSVLPDPELKLFHDSTVIAANDNWQSAANAGQIPTTFRPPDSRESVILITLNPGSYTAILSGVNNTTGIGLVEVYDLSPASASLLSNISTRGFVETGDGVMIGGLIVSGGSGTTQVLVRALGPTLTQIAGLPGTLANPVISLHNAQGTVIASNNNWKDTQQVAIKATNLQPPNDLEAAILASLSPGNYTVVVSGSNNGTGIALVEVYRLN